MQGEGGCEARSGETGGTKVQRLLAVEKQLPVKNSNNKKKLRGKMRQSSQMASGQLATEAQS